LTRLLGNIIVKTQQALRHAHINSTVSSLSCADAEIHAAILAS
jgi:hypothetical protein